MPLVTQGNRMFGAIALLRNELQVTFTSRHNRVQHHLQLRTSPIEDAIVSMCMAPAASVSSGLFAPYNSRRWRTPQH